MSGRKLSTNLACPGPGFVYVVILYFLLVYIWFVQGQTYLGGPLEGHLYLRYVPYAAITIFCALAAWTLFRRSQLMELLRDPKGFIPLLIAAYILVVALLLSVRPAEIVEGLLIYLRYPVMFAMLAYLARKERLRAFLGFALLVSIAVALEAPFNYLLFGLNHDDTFLTLGPWGGHAVAGILLLYAYCYLCALVLTAGPRWWQAIFFLLVISALVISSNRGALLVLGPFFVLLYLIYKGYLSGGLLIFLSLAFNLFVLLVAYLLFIADADLAVAQIISPIYRLRYIGAVIDTLLGDGQLLIGAGIRSMNPGNTAEVGPMVQRLIEIDPRLVRAGTNQYTKALSELGLVGFGLYWLMLSLVLIQNIRLWQRIKSCTDAPAINPAVPLAFFAIWLHFSAYGLFYNDLWRFDISALLFWSVALYTHLALQEHNRT